MTTHTHATTAFVRAAGLADVRAAGAMSVQVDGHTLALFAYGERVYAVDNRCPHMGFPLTEGSVHDGILTCHWHHARFDLAGGGTFDPWADDVRAFPVELRDEAVWVDVAPQRDLRAHQRARLRDGLERNLSLVVAKAVIGLVEDGDDLAEPFRIGLDFGVRYREAGWGQGLTIHACMMNLLPYLEPEERPRALYHGLSAVAANTAGAAPRFPLAPLPGATHDPATLTLWFRRFVEVRDAEGAERCLVSAVRAGVPHRQLADMLFAAATDHRYIQTGHVLDFTNKALEALDVAGWERAESVLASLATGYAEAERMEESNAWRNPIDLVTIAERAFERLPVAPARPHDGAWPGREALVAVVLGDDPQAIADALLDALAEGCPESELAGAVAYAAALRIARFPTTNEFGDWDTALHTFTFANAVHQGLRRSPSTALVRGAFDAALSVYLDRFLNLPAVRLPEPPAAFAAPKGGTRRPRGNGQSPALAEPEALLDRQQQVDALGEWVAQYLYAGGAPEPLLAELGRLLLREDRDFHTIQTVEAAYRQYNLLRGTPAGVHVLVAAARYLAAHAPTMRAQGQTFRIAQRLARGERLFEG
jgi:nitrite reductase/ring-hydroxylating ferredoxin subunit